jgi:hypothetical protein
MTISDWLRNIFYILVIATLLSGSTQAPEDQVERVRAFTREIEFDYVSWTLDAVNIKIKQTALRTVQYIPSTAENQAVKDYLNLVINIQNTESQIFNIYSDPNVSNPEVASADLQNTLNDLYDQRKNLGPLAEAVLENQLSTIATSLDLTLGGQPIPPILYRTSALPLALIVSPREVIRQDANISLLPDLTLEQKIELEEKVDKSLNVSSLVVGIGGVGVYPTMVMQTNDLNWLVEVVAHEWVHNYLTLRPLGVNYLTSPELRTMNETTASIAGKEIGFALIEQFFPELLPPPPVEVYSLSPASPPTNEPPPFDFRAEMHTTRVTVDNLLDQGKIAEAESYMETRRIFFWENGYTIRKLNQAYFAFHGAYADTPGGAAGEDPVGAAVRALRSKSPSLASFVNRISWMWSFDQLKEAVNNP